MERSGLIKGVKLPRRKKFLTDIFYICSLRLNVFVPPLPDVQCPNFLNFQNPWINVMERVVSDLKTFAHKWCKIAAHRKSLLFGKFCLTSRIFLVSVLDFFGIGATIRIGQEILCLPSAKKIVRILICPEIT